MPQPGFRLRLTFSNGETRVYDVGPLLEQGGVFAELRDESAFRSVHAWHGTVQWSGGQDICPDTLYEDSVPEGRVAQLAVCEKSPAYRAKQSKKPCG